MYANLSKTIKEFDVSYRKGRAKISDQEFDSLVRNLKGLILTIPTFTKTIYRLLNRDLLEDYVYLEKSGRVYLMLEPPNLPTLAEKIRANIQHRKNNIIKRFI